VGCGPCYVSDCNTKWAENHLLGLHAGMAERAAQHTEGGLKTPYTRHYIGMPLRMVGLPIRQQMAEKTCTCGQLARSLHFNYVSR